MNQISFESPDHWMLPFPPGDDVTCRACGGSVAASSIDQVQI